MMSLQTTSRLRIPIVTADFFTSTHRFSASVAVGSRRFTDVLNDRISDYLEIRNIYVSRIDRPGEILGTYKLASLIKAHITFIVIASESSAQSQEQQYKTFTRRAEDVFLTVSSFEIQGKLEIVGKFDLKAILATGTTTFMSIIGAQAVNANHPDVTFAAPIILVNKKAVEFFSVLGHE
jgi:hypothetical protein